MLGRECRKKFMLLRKKREPLSPFRTHGEQAFYRRESRNPRGRDPARTTKASQADSCAPASRRSATSAPCSPSSRPAQAESARAAADGRSLLWRDATAPPSTAARFPPSGLHLVGVRRYAARRRPRAAERTRHRRSRGGSRPSCPPIVPAGGCGDRAARATHAVAARRPAAPPSPRSHAPSSPPRCSAAVRR